jgi:hypothetical protein
MDKNLDSLSSFELTKLLSETKSKEELLLLQNLKK